MTREDLFINDLQAYLGLNLSDFDKRRVIAYLEDYKANLEPVIVFKDKIVERVVIEVQKPEKVVTQDDLEREALTICNKHGIVYSKFVKPLSGKSNAEILAARKEFCSHILINYICTQNRLKEFFKVHHATISYYMVGKKIRRIKNQQSLKQTA
mgnify:CR=1 FL=1